MIERNIVSTYILVGINVSNAPTMNEIRLLGIWLHFSYRITYVVEVDAGKPHFFFYFTLVVFHQITSQSWATRKIPHFKFFFRSSSSFYSALHLSLPSNVSHIILIFCMPWLTSYQFDWSKLAFGGKQRCVNTVSDMCQLYEAVEL